jgi:hypothetical protein
LASRGEKKTDTFDKKHSQDLLIGNAVHRRENTGEGCGRQRRKLKPKDNYFALDLNENQSRIEKGKLDLEDDEFIMNAVDISSLSNDFIGISDDC